MSGFECPCGTGGGGGGPPLPVSIANGGTGSTTAPAARAALGFNPATFDAGSSGAAITLDCANGAKQTLTLTAPAPVITITGLDSIDALRLVLKQDATGGRVPSFVVAGAVLRYQAGQVPLWSTSPGARDRAMLTFDAVDNIVDIDAGIGYAAP